MAGVCRLGDKAKAPVDNHGCPLCPHANVTGPALIASFNVNINGLPALRAGDGGLHAACCGTNKWTIIKGSAKVIVNGQQLVRKGDPTQHCGGKGKMDEASGNVIDGSGDAEHLEQLREGILEWLERVRENGIAELLHMVSPGLGALYFSVGELGKLFSPECRGTDYFKHFAKCSPSKPPGWDDHDHRGPHGPHPVPVSGPRSHRPPEGVKPVGLLDPTNPITDLVTLPVIAVRGAGAAAEVAPRAAKLVPEAGKWVVDGAGAAAEVAPRAAKLVPEAGKWVVDGIGDGVDALAGAFR
jgi:uncharacterized Zn-binding protein involved in type VI secretion